MKNKSELLDQYNKEIDGVDSAIINTIDSINGNLNQEYIENTSEIEILGQLLHGLMKVRSDFLK